jgi:hypothetical protein
MDAYDVSARAFDLLVELVGWLTCQKGLSC